MTGDDTDIDDPPVSMPIGRRSLLAGATTAVAGGLAGCSEVTDQSFEASTVALPEGDREELWLLETLRDATTAEREGPADSQVEITSKTTGYSRSDWLEGQ